jgi:hypothetical protein
MVKLTSGADNGGTVVLTLSPSFSLGIQWRVYSLPSLLH